MWREAEGAGEPRWFLWEGTGQAGKRAQHWLVGIISAGSGVGAILVVWYLAPG